jgi:hypothetical protein
MLRSFTIPFFSIVTFLGWKTYMTRNKGMKDETIADDYLPNL